MRSVLVALGMALHSSASNTCPSGKCGDASNSTAGLNLLQSKTKLGAVVEHDPLQGWSKTSVADCPGDMAATATQFWKDFFEDQCEVEWTDVDSRMKKSILAAVSTPAKKLDGTLHGQKCEVLVTMPGPNGVQNGGDISFEISPPDLRPVWEAWDVVPGSATYFSHMGCSDPCFVFGPEVPRLKPMVASKVEGVFGQLKDIYAEQCGEENKYKLSLAADSSKGMMTAKQHMTEANGRYGFSFFLDVYVDTRAEPMSTYIKVNANAVHEEDAAVIEAKESDELHEEALEEEAHEHNNTGLIQNIGGRWTQGKRQQGLFLLQGRTPQYLRSCKRASTPKARGELPVTGPWTVDRTEIQPPLCCLCSGCADNSVCTEGGSLERDMSVITTTTTTVVVPEGAVTHLVMGQIVWTLQAPRGVPVHGSNESRQSPLRRDNHFTLNGPVAQVGLPNRNPRRTGDTFHATVLSKRSSADHEKIWSQSRALIALVKAKRKSGDIPSSYHFFDDDTRAQCWKLPYNQGECGSCWAFASLGALEKQMCMKGGGQLAPSLSREMLVRCSEQNGGCEGGNADKAYEDLMEIGGVFSTDCLPYQGKGSKHCPGFAYSWFGQGSAGKTGKFVKIDQELQQSCGDHTRYTNRPPMGAEWNMPFNMMYEDRFGIPIPPEALNDTRLVRFKTNYAKSRSRDRVASFWLYGEEAMRAAVVEHGSIYASYMVMDDFKQRMCSTGCWPPGTVWGEEAYILSTGVFQASECKGECGHAVHIVGFGEDIQETGLRVPYWLIENSWGANTATGDAVHGNIMGVDAFGVSDFGEDPWSTLHPMNAEDQCIIAGWAKSHLPVTGAGKEARVNIRKDIEITGGDPDGFWLSIAVDGQEVYNVSVPPGQPKQFMKAVKLEPGNHTMTFSVYAGNHPLQQALELEQYSLVATKMRCRGKGYRYSFHQNDTEASLSWGRLTRNQLRAKADEIMQAAGVDPAARLASCPEECRTGSFSEVHPCVGLLMSWGTCYADESRVQHSYYQDHAKADCQQCDQLSLLETERQSAVKNLDNATFSEWHGYVMQAFDAPDEPGWMRQFWGSCVINAMGFRKNCKLDATYRFAVPFGSDGTGSCDETHSAPYRQGEFVNAPGHMASGTQVETRCPMPLRGSVQLKCDKGVLSVVDHTCAQRGNMLNSSGYFKMLRGVNYHGIEDGGAFAMAEMSRFPTLCPTSGWTKWSECSAIEPCSKGAQTRTRQPVEPLTTADPLCANLDFEETRSCVAPGMCKQVLSRMIAGTQSDIPGFLATYKSLSTSLPFQKAGAHILDSIHPNCSDAQYWCSLITGDSPCGMYFEGHFEVKKSGDYFLRYEASEGRGEFRFNTLGEGNELDHEYLVTTVDGTSKMYEWQDFGFHHRRRRTNTQPWEMVSSVHLKKGFFYARMTRTRWTSCPTFNLKLERTSTVYASPKLHTTMAQSVDGEAAATADAEWRNDWGAVDPWILRRRSSDKEKGYQNEMILRTTSGGDIVGKVPINKLSFSSDDLYSLFGINDRVNPKGGSTYQEMELVIRSTVIIPDEGTYKFKYQQDTTSDSSNVAWRRSSRRRSTKVVVRVGEAASNSVDSRVGSATLEVTHHAKAPGTVTFEISSIMHYDNLNNWYTLPNFVEVELKQEDFLHGNTLDFGSVTNYMSSVEALSGGDDAHISWPDRDNPLDSELRISSFQKLPRDSLLVGSKGMSGFMAHTEGVIDAGACLSLQARVPGAAASEFGGLALELCDINGAEQYLELNVYKVPAVAPAEEASNASLDRFDKVRIGWVHIGFTQATHLKIIRSPKDLGRFEVSYRPDDRLDFAEPFASEKIKAATNGYTGVMDVGVSMFTPESYRYAEFYNVSLNPCAGSCESSDGKQVYCGNYTTACGDVLDCGATCSNAGVCSDNVCMDCPELDIKGTELASWECGQVRQVCHSPDGRAMQVHREVGVPAPTANHECAGDQHKWVCHGKTSWAYLAEGLQCGQVVNRCGETIDIAECPLPNDACVEHRCVCTPSVFPPDYNCGWAADGCGTKVSFGDPKVAELQLPCAEEACYRQIEGLSGSGVSQFRSLESKYQVWTGGSKIPETMLVGTLKINSPCSRCAIAIEGWLKAPNTADFSFIVKHSLFAKIYAASEPYSLSEDFLQVVYDGLSYSPSKQYSGNTKISWEEGKHYYVRAVVAHTSGKPTLSIGLKQEDGGPEWMPMPMTMFDNAGKLCPAGGVCNNHKCCTPLTAADFPSERSCGSVANGCGGTLFFGGARGACPFMQKCNHETFTCEEDEDATQVLFAVLTKNACAERLPYGSRALSEESGAYFSTEHKDLQHSRWTQMVRPYGTPDATVDFGITYEFQQAKTLKERFISLTTVGETVNFTVQAASGDTFHMQGEYRFSDGAGIGTKMDSSGSSGFSSDDGAWGASASTVNGNSHMQSDFWGVGNFNSGDSQCSKAYMHGRQFIGSGDKEMNVKSLMFMY